MGNRNFHSIGSGISYSAPEESAGWKLKEFTIEKFWVDPFTGVRQAEPYEVIRSEGNMLMYGGAAAMWQLFIGASFTPFNEANSYLGVGDSDTPSDRTQTDLLASSNKYYIPMNTGYPLHTDGTGSGNANIIYKGTAGTAVANFNWNEWGLFNGSATGRMANRKVEDLGTKTAAAEWDLTIVISLS